MSSIPSIYAPMLKSYLKNQTNQKINSTQKGDNDCSMSRGDRYRTNKIKKKTKQTPRLTKTREKKSSIEKSHNWKQIFPRGAGSCCTDRPVTLPLSSHERFAPPLPPHSNSYNEEGAPDTMLLGIENGANNQATAQLLSWLQGKLLLAQRLLTQQAKAKGVTGTP